MEQTEYTEKQKRQIANVQQSLDWMANRIDESIELDGETDNAYALCMRLMHAQSSALLHLIKKGQTGLEFKNKLE